MSTDGADVDEDPRVVRLEREVQVWEPSSHAMWAVWGIVQAKEDLLYKVAKWKKACVKSQADGVTDGVAQMGLEDEGRPKVTRGKSGEALDEQEDEEELVADFDYLSYSLGRMQLFRRELKALGIVD